MLKNKFNRSLFSTFVEQVNHEPSSAEYHLVENEYFAAFNSLDDIEQFHNKLITNPSMNKEAEKNEDDRDGDNQIDMKTFAQRFLIDLPEPMATAHSSNTSPGVVGSPKSTEYKKRKEVIPADTPTPIGNRRKRRNIRDLPQSSNFIFMSDDEDNGNIFDSLRERKSLSSSRIHRIAYEDMSSILLTLDVKQKRRKHLARNENEEPTIAIELAEPSMIKTESLDQEQLVITHVIETKEEPVEINVTSTGPMSFGRLEYSGVLDNFVQNIHRSCPTNVSITDPSLSRPKRIRKRKRLYIEESEPVIKAKRIRKKRARANITSTLLTDAEIEQQFGERLSPVIKSEQDNEQILPNINRQRSIEIETTPQTPIEKARAKLMNALARGYGPDTFLLKIRSREGKMIEIELAIYGTADWHSHRIQIISKIEEALRGLRVSWTKIDIRVDDFDVQICTSPQAASATPPLSLTSANSSWFLKALSESGPLIIHIHDRRKPRQRNCIRCPCPQCSSGEQIDEPSPPVIVNISSAKVFTHRLPSPTILRRTDQTFKSISSSFQTIHPSLFKNLVHQYGTSTITSIAQCVLDLTLTVSVHSSLSYLQESKENYREKYQQVIDPVNSTIDDRTVLKSTIDSDILIFHRTVKQHKANIRNAHSMKDLIFHPNARTSSPNVLKTNTTLILPKQSTNPRSLFINRLNKRQRNQLSTSDNSHGMKQQAHFTPIIELKPILSGSTTLNEQGDNDQSKRKVTKIISTNTIQRDSQRINTITTQESTPRVIRLSITKPSNSIRLSSLMNQVETPSLVPKQINIIKPLSSSTAPAIKLSNPILITNRSQQPPMK